MSPGEGAVTALAFFAPAGGYNPTHLLSGSADGSVSVWAAGGGWESMKTMRGHRREVTAIAVHPSGLAALTTSRCLAGPLGRFQEWGGAPQPRAAGARPAAPAARVLRGPLVTLGWCRPCRLLCDQKASWSWPSSRALYPLTPPPSPHSPPPSLPACALCFSQGLLPAHVGPSQGALHLHL